MTVGKRCVGVGAWDISYNGTFPPIHYRKRDILRKPPEEVPRLILTRRVFNKKTFFIGLFSGVFSPSGSGRASPPNDTTGTHPLRASFINIYIYLMGGG